jgi:hypothetical protein
MRSTLKMSLPKGRLIFNVQGSKIDLMAFLTTNPSPFLINVPELQNVVTSATGSSGSTAAVTNSVNSLLTYIDTTAGTATLNSISAVNGTTLNVQNNLNLDNAALLINSAATLTSNSVSGSAFLSLEVGGVEEVRVAGGGGGVGIGLAAPIATLDVNGPLLVRGAVYISTMGAPLTSTMGNLYADGDVFANGVYYPSDPGLKSEVRPYRLEAALPTPVEFLWRKTGVRDIGVLADEVAALEPACVQRTRDGTLTVDYAKLTVLLLAEVRDLRRQVEALRS